MEDSFFASIDGGFDDLSMSSSCWKLFYPADTMNHKSLNEEQVSDNSEDSNVTLTSIAGCGESMDSGVKGGSSNFEERIMVRMDFLERKINQLTKVLSHNTNSTGGSVQVKKSTMDDFCLNLFLVNPDPDTKTMNQTVQSLIEYYQGEIDHKSAQSQIRKWFRKKREEVGIKFSAAIKKESLKRRYHVTDEDLQRIITKSKLPMPLSNVTWDFYRKKFESCVNKA